MTTALDARSVTSGYTAQPVIRDVDLHVDVGEVVALLGANGAGKTTTLLALVGELPLHAGEVHVGGERTAAPLYKRAKRGMGFVPEGRTVFKSLSTAENLSVAKVERDVAACLFPELDSRMDVRAGLLSGGEQRMLALACALGRTPKLLLADELSLGLAPRVVTRLLEAVREAAAAQGMGVLLVEQQVRKVLRYADRAYVMRRGRIEMQLSASEALTRIVEIERSYLSHDVTTANGRDGSGGASKTGAG
jgi:branched-chain amino acid transport system ATP-binding protein